MSEKIYINRDEWYPCYNWYSQEEWYYEGYEELMITVDQETIERWTAIMISFNHLQEELSELYFKVYEDVKKQQEQKKDSSS